MTDHETDQEPGAQHPRQTLGLTGHAEAEALLDAAFRGARAHHAWMLTGPKGVGKATLAYRAARILLGARRTGMRQTGARPFDVEPDDPVVRRIAQLAHPDLFVLRCGRNDRGKPRREISVEEARGLSGFLALQPAEGGWRVAVIDAVDDLNRNAANAILKLLEEPPAKVAIFLISHSPGGVLATIRSRVRRLALRPLDAGEMAAALDGEIDGRAKASVMALSDGRPGRAIALAAIKAQDLDAALDEGLQQALRNRPAALMRLAGLCSGPQAEAKANVLIALMRQAAWRAAISASGLEGQPAGWWAKAERGVSAEKLAAAYSEIMALEGGMQGLDMDPALAISRASAVMLEAMS